MYNRPFNTLNTLCFALKMNDAYTQLSIVHLNASELSVLKAVYPCFFEGIGGIKPIYMSVELSGIDMSSFFKHLDLVLTPTGLKQQKQTLVLLAHLCSPSEQLNQLVKQGNQHLNLVAQQLQTAQVAVIRNPIPLLSTNTNELWIAYFNNALVECTAPRPKVWLSAGHPKNFEHQNFIETCKQKNIQIWQNLGFEVSCIERGLGQLYSHGDRGGGLRCLCVDFR